MVGDPRRHCRCARDPVCPSRASNIQWHTQTLVISTEIVNRSDEIHTHLKRLGLAQETAPASNQTSEASTKSGVQPLNVGCVDHAVTLSSLHQAIDLGFGSLSDASHDTNHMPLRILLHDLRDV